ncbi:MAG TPA: glycoside hydrolase family 172 protein [Myxococcota bacterium]|nr:glycoside hydrolase family 172 protein [Myxococcota bacterium]
MQLGLGSLADLARLRPFRRRRLSSWDRSGGNRDALLISPFASASLGEIAGAGCVKHVWVTLTALPERPDELCSTVLRMFWDGENSPSVEVPVGDFFGLGFGRRRNFWSLPLQMSPEDGKGMNCWFPMPFAKGARFEVENQSDVRLVFYYYIDYEEYDALDPELARFHAAWRRRNPTAGRAREKGWTRRDYRLDDQRPVGPGFGFPGPWDEPNLDGKDNYVILDVAGEGQYVGCVLNVDVFERQVNDWYGEGDDMIFVDGEPWPPRLHGTGTEDYFNTAFCPTQEYCAPYHGVTLYSGNPAWPWGGKNSCYRFHVEDPIRFERSIRVTIETGHANALANDVSSTAYWYQRGRREPLSPLPAVDARRPRPDPPGLGR